jgi:hypothetical protein
MLGKYFTKEKHTKEHIKISKQGLEQERIERQNKGDDARQRKKKFDQ